MEQNIAQQLLKIRDALIAHNRDEAYHQLYKLANPEFDSPTPWASIEFAAATPSPDKAEQEGQVSELVDELIEVIYDDRWTGTPTPQGKSHDPSSKVWEIRNKIVEAAKIKFAEQEGLKPISSYLREYSQLKEYEKLLGGGKRPEYTLEMVRAMGWQEVLHMLTGYVDILNLMDGTIYALEEGAGEWETEAGDWKWKFEMVFAALKELTDLKAIKAHQGETPDYLERKPKAWEVAKQLTTGYKIEKREQEGLRWVRITDAESLPPESNSASPKKYAVRYQMSDSDGNNPEIGQDWLTASEVANECQGCDWFEWLDESTPPVKEDYDKKYKEANQFIIDLAKELGQEGLGYDDLSWTIEDFIEAAKAKFETIKEAGQPADDFAAHLLSEPVHAILSLILKHTNNEQREALLDNLERRMPAGERAGVWRKGEIDFPVRKIVVAKKVIPYLGKEVVGTASSSTGEMITFDWGISSVSLRVGHEELNDLLWLDETASPSQQTDWEAAYHKLFALYQPLRERADEVDILSMKGELAFAEWLRTFEALEKRDNQWVLESQISSEKLWHGWQQSQNNKP